MQQASTKIAIVSGYLFWRWDYIKTWRQDLGQTQSDIVRFEIVSGGDDIYKSGGFYGYTIGNTSTIEAEWQNSDMDLWEKIETL